MLAPRPWTALPTGAANLWEGRRKQLAAVEMGGGSVASANFGATAVQPAVSQGLQLDFLKERDEVNRVCLSLCAFGWPENPAQVASKREVVIEANNQAMACGPGISEGGGPANYKSWPTALCDRLLESAAPGGCVSLREGIPRDEGWAWETAPVSSISVPEENLREHGSTGERYDYITYDGTATQQPRRLRQTVAHLHITLGHLSNGEAGQDAFVEWGPEKCRGPCAVFKVSGMCYGLAPSSYSSGCLSEA